jgi:hypothetical protein
MECTWIDMMRVSTWLRLPPLRTCIHSLFLYQRRSFCAEHADGSDFGSLDRFNYTFALFCPQRGDGCPRCTKPSSLAILRRACANQCTEYDNIPCHDSQLQAGASRGFLAFLVPRPPPPSRDTLDLARPSSQATTGMDDDAL